MRPSEPPLALGSTTRSGLKEAEGSTVVGDLQVAQDVLGFVGRALRRQRRVAAYVFAAVVALVAVLAPILPRYYRVDTRVMTSRSYVLPALVNPRRSVPVRADDPTHGVRELLKSRASLERIMEMTALKTRWHQHRPLVGRLKDGARRLVKGPMSEEDFHEALLEILDDKLQIAVEQEVVRLTAVWSDPDTAYTLTKATLERFLEIRREAELSQIDETIRILERNVADAEEVMRGAADGFESLIQAKEDQYFAEHGISKEEQARVRREMSQARRRRPQVSAADRAALEVEVQTIERQLDEERRVLRGQRSTHELALKNAGDTLQRLQASLGAHHPDVVAAQRALDGLQQNPPDLSGQEARVSGLEESLRQSRVRLAALAPASGEATGSSDDEEDDGPSTEEFYKTVMSDPEVVRSLAYYRSKQEEYGDLFGRLANARMELETARVALGYRYRVTVPPLFPKEAEKPKMALIVIGGIFLALMAGAGAAFVADIARWRILEAWQVRRFLGLPVMGELRGLRDRG